MTTLIALIVLTVVAVALTRYARHDHFAGPASTTSRLDDLGSLADRNRLVPRR